MRLRIGLIGLGDVWQVRYAPALRALADRFEVRAICDPVRHRAEQAAADFHAEAVDGYHLLVQREDVDAVFVLSPQWFGAMPILAACEAGKAIYCAVALDLTPDEAQTVKRRVEEAGVAFVAEFPRRQAPATIRLKELIATKLGEPRLLFCHQRSVADPPATHLTGATPLHPTYRHMIGQVDWCRYVADRKPTSVVGVMHYAGNVGQVANLSHGGTEDYRMMSLDFSPPGKPGAGPTAQISVGRYIPAGWEEAIAFRPLAALQVSCAKGIAFVDLPTTLVWFDEVGRHQESLESERPVGEQLLTHFYRSVTSLLRRTCDLEDAYLALRVVQAARQSHEEGRRMEL
jgi:predicted dehydrogenase